MKKLQVSTEVPTEIHMTREFDAPRHLVIKAMTTPELVKRWLGNTRSDITSVEVDFRVGGKYRYEFRNKKDGSTFAFGGTFDEIGPDRIVQTEHFEGAPGSSRVTTSYSEHDGKTTLHIVLAFPTKEIRDMVVATGMSDGAGESYDGLEKLLAQL